MTVNIVNRRIIYTQALAGLDSATTAWVAAVLAAGGTVSDARKSLINDLITGLKSDNVYPLIDRLWLTAAENTQSALIDIVNISTATLIGSPTFTVDRGYAGNLSTAINTNFNPAGGGFNYTQNSASVSIWDNTNRAMNSEPCVGTYDGGTGVVDITPFDSNLTAIRLNQTVSVFTAANIGSQGFFTANRSGSAAVEIYKDGSLLGSGSNVSTHIPNLVQYLCGRNDTGSLTGTTDQMSCGVWAGSLSATDAANLYTRLRTYMTAVGVP